MSQHHENPFSRKGTQLHAISELLLEGKSREDIFREIYPLVLNQREPFVFSDNVNGARIPKPIHDQIPLAFYAIGRVRVSLLDKNPSAINHVAIEDSSAARNYASKAWRARLYQTVRAELEASEPEPFTEPEPEPMVLAPTTLEEKAEYLYRRISELRIFVQSRKLSGREFDYVSTRAYVYGVEALIQGIEPDDFLWSIGCSWPDDIRSQAGLNYSVDYSQYAIEDTPLQLGFIVRLMRAGIPVYLCGPTGSGKSVLARMAADYLTDGKYGEIPLSLGVSRSDLFGSWTANPDPDNAFVNRPFTEIYGNGGVFCFEEIDAADPNILLAVNNAIANKSLFNTSNGSEIVKSENYYAVATANTWGNGATANFGGREGLDGSSLDRFKYGRVYVDYNVSIERGIVFNRIAEHQAANAV